ncbi:MAG: hypothetical protein BZ137_07990 [Methanosphaera sp. rholeuAM130]|nr:VWA domain-containing protein [Methanosphaera sp.]RAP52904.1 MAG: hypothetical protein BZ137_07990 [Methanosphaera sp. rholeuAM130]
MNHEKILTLSYFLRREGVNVSIRSSMTATIIWDRYKSQFTLNELKDALKSVYVKNKEDLPKYERAFNNVFIFNRDTKYKKADYVPLDVNKNYHYTKTASEGIMREDSTRETIIRRRLEHKKLVDNSILGDEISTLDSIDYRVYSLCQKFSKKIANHRSLRKKEQFSHKINIPQTIRKNLKNGGHLIDVVYNRPPKHKSKHIFLCDISISCQWATTWFFALMCGCHKSFDKLRIYDFDHRIVDVTEALDVEFKNSFQINVAHQSMGLRPRGHSDMTKAFGQFLKECNLDYQTDVIILTDCRDWNGRRTNGVLESAKILRKIIVKSRNVYIFNPENKIRWNTPTSCVDDYEEVGAKVFQTSTLNEFAKVIREI